MADPENLCFSFSGDASGVGPGAAAERNRGRVPPSPLPDLEQNTSSCYGCMMTRWVCGWMKMGGGINGQGCTADSEGKDTRAVIFQSLMAPGEHQKVLVEHCTCPSPLGPLSLAPASPSPPLSCPLSCTELTTGQGAKCQLISQLGTQPCWGRSGCITQQHTFIGVHPSETLAHSGIPPRAQSVQAEGLWRALK